MRITRTNQFGYYRFYQVATNAGYTVTVTHKTLVFAPQTFMLNGEFTDLNFFGSRQSP